MASIRTRTRRRLLLLRMFSVLVVGGVLILHLLTRPRTDEDRVLAVHAELFEAFVDEDFDEVWDLLGEWTRRHVEDCRRKPALHLPDLFGLTSDDIAGMSTEEFFVAFHERGVERHPEAWREVRGEFAALRVDRVEFQQSPGGLRLALVTCRGHLLGRSREVSFGYVNGEGEWRAVLPAYHSGMNFLKLERKIEAWLPKSRIDPATVDFLVEIGPGEIDDETLASLRKHLRSREPEYGGVVIDAAPDTSWQAVVSVVNAIHECGATEPVFARTEPPGPLPGLRLNGVPVGTERIPDPPRDHPALRRTLILGDH